MYIRDLSQITKADAAIAGGKGAFLGDMLAAGIPVPPGFVVLTTAYDKFGFETLSQALIAEILQAFDTLDAEYVAVRSSATVEDGDTAAWAGQLESYLYVTRDELIEAIKKSWASIDSQRAIEYRREKWLDKITVSVAVVVQRMVVAELSGVVFTSNPVTGSNNEMMIEAVYGDNEQLVGGVLTPDTYLINKHSGAALWAEVSPQTTMRRNKQSLPVPPEIQAMRKIAGNNLRELIDMCKKIEAHYKKPMDIEWVHDGDQFYIVQARPITTFTV